MGTVGTAEGVGRRALQFGTYGCQIALRHYHVGVEYEQVVAFSTLGTIVPALSRSAVGLIIIMYIELAGVFVADILTGNG